MLPSSAAFSCHPVIKPGTGGTGAYCFTVEAQTWNFASSPSGAGKFLYVRLLRSRFSYIILK